MRALAAGLELPGDPHPTLASQGPPSPASGRRKGAAPCSTNKKARAIPSPVYGRTQPHVVGSDEGSRGLAGTSHRPSSDPCFARATFSHKWEKEGRGPLVRTAGLEPALPCEKQIFLPLRLSPPPFKKKGRSWSGLSLRLGRLALGAPRLVSTPSRDPGLGSGLAWADRPLAFPEFGRFYAADFPAGTPIEVCCVYHFATSA